MIVVPACVPRSLWSSFELSSLDFLTTLCRFEISRCPWKYKAPGHGIIEAVACRGYRHLVPIWHQYWRQTCNQKNGISIQPWGHPIQGVGYGCASAPADPCMGYKRIMDTARCVLRICQMCSVHLWDVLYGSAGCALRICGMCSVNLRDVVYGSARCVLWICQMWSMDLPTVF